MNEFLGSGEKREKISTLILNFDWTDSLLNSPYWNSLFHPRHSKNISWFSLVSVASGNGRKETFVLKFIQIHVGLKLNEPKPLTGFVRKCYWITIAAHADIIHCWNKISSVDKIFVEIRLCSLKWSGDKFMLQPSIAVFSQMTNS